MPGALITYSGCSEANHSLFKYLVVTKDGKTVRSPVETVSGLDYSKISLRHFNKALETKIGRNSYLAIKPPKFIFRSGHSSIKNQKYSNNQPSKTKRSEESSIIKRKSTLKQLLKLTTPKTSVPEEESEKLTIL